MINTENWNYCSYVNNNFKATISMGGDLSPNDQIVKEIYWLNVTTLENQTISQRTFNDIRDAIRQINQQYAHWVFTDPLKPTSGCSSCSAH
ncbi:MAG: hypothetical protein U0T83_10200 [Bacteriovoracaceae bacterium]